MGQIEIIQYLSKQDKPLSRMQISIGLEENDTKVSHLIKKLIKSGEVKFIEVDRNKAKELLGEQSPLRRCKLYFV